MGASGSRSASKGEHAHAIQVALKEEEQAGPDPAGRALRALQDLQKTLHLLTPAQQWDVKKELPFATTEWQEGLALSIKPVKPGFGESVHGQQNFGNLVSESGAQQRIRLTPDAGKIILILVGLPARCKSMYGAKLEQFLSWRGYKTKTFKVGAWRRGERQGQGKNKGDTTKSPLVGRRGLAGLAEHGEEKASGKEDERAQHSAASFFDSTKAYATTTREQVTIEAFKELLGWLETEKGQIAIFDASNVTIARRAKLTELINRHMNKHRSSSISAVYIESICTNEELLQRNMLIKVKLSADFKGMPVEEAMTDLGERIAHYEKNYQTVREAEGSYIKIFDLRAKVHACNIYGRMSKSVLPYLMAVHAIDRPVFILPVYEPDASKNVFETEEDALPGGKLPEGLSRWVSSYPRASELIVLTSTQPRALALANAITGTAKTANPGYRAQLAPLQRVKPASGSGEPGSAPGSPMKQQDGSFRENFGESVANLVTRLEPIAIEIEAATAPVLIIAHEGACRTLRGELMPSILEPAPLPSAHACC
jgi:hypothetical protein